MSNKFKIHPDFNGFIAIGRFKFFSYAHSKGAVLISLYVMLLGLVALLILRLKQIAED